MKKAIFPSLLILTTLFSKGQSTAISASQYKADFNFFWTSINDEYCYFNKKQSDWQKVKEIYTPAIDSITNRDQFVAILEKTIYELYDHHAGLNTNTDNSRRLVPSGTDTWAEYVNGKPFVTELRPEFGAEACGIIPGMEIIAVNDIPISTAIIAFKPISLRKPDAAADNFALRLVLAGNHVQPRKFTLRYKGITKDYFPDKKGFLLEHIKYPSLVETKMLGDIGYIKINDCLYDNELIAAFDSVMQKMKNTKALIIDLRSTPSGGNTTVARAILGWFINREYFYQKHEYYAEEKIFGVKRSWEEIVSPRAGKYYNKPLAVLCNHWTGSVSEALTIGFDAMNRPHTKTIGTPMAGLCGAVYSYEMPNTKIHFSFPAERVYHVSGLPRENYKPSIIIDLPGNESSTTNDRFISKAIGYLKSVY